MFGVSVKNVEAWGKRKKTSKLVKALSNSKNEIRAAAAKALGNINSEESTNALILALRDPDPNVRINAVDSLRNSGNSLAIEHLKNVAKSDQDPKVREQACLVLGINTNQDS